MTLGDYIKNYIEAHNMTGEEFAAKCGLSKGYMSMIINNRNPRTGKPPVPKIETYQRIADALGMTVTDLLRETEKDTPSYFHTVTPEYGKRVQEMARELERSAADLDEALWQKREAARRNPNRRILFDIAENGTERYVDAVVSLVDALKATNSEFYDGDDPA